MSQRTAVVIGVGPEAGLGAALCKRFAKESYHVYVAGRSDAKLKAVVADIVAAGGSAEAVVTDVTKESDVVALFDRTMPTNSRLAPDLIVYNAGNNKQIAFSELTSEVFESFWRVGPLGTFLVGREVVRRILSFGGGTLIYTGASASMRGKPGYAHFSSSKAGVRMIAQSLAREYGRHGLHVAHVIIDGGIDGDKFRINRPDVYAKRGADGLLNIVAVAETYWQLHCQHPSAWTQEIDLRPCKETF